LIRLSDGEGIASEIAENPAYSIPALIDNQRKRSDDIDCARRMSAK
jgi:hypothetical protein